MQESLLPLTDSQTGSFLRGTLLPWYCLQRPRAVVQTYLRYASAFAEAFSIIFLLRTLVSPWKNIRDAYPARGFHLSIILQTLTFNVIARAIGAVVRIGAIFIGLLVQLIVLCGFALYLAAWLLFPLLFLAGMLVLLGLF